MNESALRPGRIALVAASAVFIAIYSWAVIAEPQGAAHVVANGILAATWVVFIADYVVRLLRAPERGRWFRRHLFGLAVVLFPPLRPVQLISAVTLLQSRGHATGTVLRRNLVVTSAGTALVLVWVAALAMLQIERHAPGAAIVTIGDAIWWAFTTLSTVGYGDLVPVTGWGRVIGILLMCTGLAVIGVVTATLASWIIERATADDTAHPATKAEVRALAAQLDRIEAQLDRRAD